MNNLFKRPVSIIEKFMHTWFDVNVPIHDSNENPDLHLPTYMNCQRPGCACNKTIMLENE